MNGKELKSGDLNQTISLEVDRKGEQFIMLLYFSEVNINHVGNFTCEATNKYHMTRRNIQVLPTCKVTFIFVVVVVVLLNLNFRFQFYQFSKPLTLFIKLAFIYFNRRVIRKITVITDAHCKLVTWLTVSAIYYIHSSER